MLFYLIEHPVLWILVTFYAVWGVVYGVFWWAKGGRKKTISYAVEHFALKKSDGSAAAKLEPLFDHQEAEPLTAAKIALWNSGNKAVRSGDMAQENPLTLSVPQGKILDVQVLKQSENHNAFSVELKDGSADLSFHCMEKNQGVILQVYYTGPADALTLSGTIVGGAPLKKTGYFNAGSAKPELAYSLPAFTAAVFTPMILVVASLIDSLNRSYFVAPAFCLIDIAIFYVLLFKKWDVFFPGIPKGLR